MEDWSRMSPTESLSVVLLASALCLVDGLQYGLTNAPTI